MAKATAPDRSATTRQRPKVRRRRRGLITAAVVCGLLASSVAAPAHAAAPSDADWLGWFNLYRAQAGLNLVSESSTFSTAALDHSQWMAKNNYLSHPECKEPVSANVCDPVEKLSDGVPTFDGTLAGHTAGMQGNISYFTNDRTNRAFLESWMTGPFHSAGMLDPGLTTTGFGRGSNAAAAEVRFAATLNILGDVRAFPAGTMLPIGWPGNGSVTSMTSYTGGEYPDPLTPCAGYATPTGLPIVVRYGRFANISVTTSSLVEIDDDGATVAPLEVCAYGSQQYTNADDGDAQTLGRQVLDGHASVVLIPRQPLVVGKRYRYAVSAQVPGLGLRTFKAAFRVGAVADAAPPGPGPFADVSSFHPFAEEIEWMKKVGLAAGSADGTFKPTNAASRQAMASFLWKLNNAPVVACPGSGFTDVGIDHPFRNAICWMAATGLSTGYADGTFRPTAPVSRQATASFLYRLDTSPSGPFPNPGFSDVPVDHKFFTAIAWMVNDKVGGGFADGTFRPDNAVSRQATAAFLFRYQTRTPA